MNLLKDIPLKEIYDPSVDGMDVLNNFYIPCLSVSKRYDRCSAYFSSSILRRFSQGLNKFVASNGHIRFIFSCQINSEEMNNIQYAYKLKMDGLAEEIGDDLDDDFDVANLAYLVANNIVEIKIAFMLNSRASLMHMKAGLFEDNENNKVYFFGSGNETESGILYNSEIFHVSTNFNGDKNMVTSGEEIFEKLWNNTYSPDIKTEFPIGKLFEKLQELNRGRIFDSNKDFYEFNDCVVIDIDKKNGHIILSDYTHKHELCNPAILKSTFKNKMQEVDNNIYIINELNLHLIRDIIIKRLNRYGVKFILSLGTQLYIEQNDLILDKRQKLGLSIKNNVNLDLWIPDYFKFKNIVDSNMIAKLKDEQMRNAFFHFCMKSSADFSVPGTGKTYISYALFAYLYADYLNQNIYNVNHLVVFGPLNCFMAWKEESKKIFGNIHNFSIFDVTKHHNDFDDVLRNEKFNIYLINYDLISEERYKLIADTILNSEALVVFDEIHKLKSITGIRANLFKNMFSYAKDKPIFKLALTGTPIPNSFLDIYNVLNILYRDDMTGLFASLSTNNLKLADNDENKREIVKNKLNPLFVRTTKKDLKIPPADLDDKTTLYSAPTQVEEELYILIRKACSNPLVKFIRLIQATSNPKLLLKKINIKEIKELYDEDNDIFDSFYDETLLFADEIKNKVEQIGIASKMKKTLDLIVNLVLKNKKVLVWGLFVDTIDFIVDYLNNKGIPAISVTGRDKENRDDKINEFKYGTVKVLVTNPNTLAESISLHTVCHDAIYVEFGFNLTYLLQSKDRIHRVGLTDDIHTHYYFAITSAKDNYGSIDEYIYEKLQIKANRMIKTIEDNDLAVLNTKTDKEDIIEILDML